MNLKQTVLIKRLGAFTQGIMLLNLVVFVCIVLWSGLRMDSKAMGSAGVALESIIRKDQDLLAKAAKDNGWWSETIHNVVEGRNPEWLDSNFGPYLVGTYGVDRLIVVEPDGQQIYQEIQGLPEERKYSSHLQAALSGAVNQVQLTSWLEPEPISGWIEFDDHIFMVAVAAITPDEISETPLAHKPRPVLIFLSEVNDAVVAEWQKDADLKSLALVYNQGDKSNDDYKSFYSLTGEGIAHLTWDIERPSYWLLIDVSPLFVVGILILMIAVYFMHRQFNAAMKLAIASEINEKSLKNRERHFRGLADQAPVLIWITDPEGRLTFINEQAKKMLKGIHSNLIIKRWYKLIHPEDRSRLSHWFVRATKNQEYLECEFRISTNKENYRWVSAKGTPHISPEGDFSGFLFSGIDITDKKQVEDKVWRQANYDSLTNLPNRYLLLDRLQAEIERAKRQSQIIAVMYIDLDNFKNINDTQGHRAGDTLLIEAAQRINCCLRLSDTLARLGGDEFVILIPNAQQQLMVEQIVARIINKLQAPFVIEGIESQVTASVGISIYPNDGDCGDVLLMNADRAMYGAKDGGRNGYSYFEQAMNVDLNEKILLEKEVKIAIKEQQFILHYQPIVDVTSNEIVGAEALVRWLHPEKGLIPPDKFIPVLEESKLICDLGVWIIDKAVSELKQWQDNYDFKGYMAINVSSVQFYESDVCKDIRFAVEKHHVESCCIQVEITESLFLRDSEKVMAGLRKIQRLGAKLALDDFGTGYSSLSYLNSFKVDVLKIDRSFIMHIPDNKESKTLTGAILAMASNLGLVVVAEGIETIEQLEFLQQHNCDRGQGYYFNKPLTSGQFDELLLTLPKPEMIGLS